MIVCGTLDVASEHVTRLGWDELAEAACARIRQRRKHPAAVLCACRPSCRRHHTKVPLRRLCFGARGIWERRWCVPIHRPQLHAERRQHSVALRSRGGKTLWHNYVLAHREIEQPQCRLSPTRSRLRLRKQPAAPRALLATVLVRNHHAVRDWAPFIADPPAQTPLT